MALDFAWPVTIVRTRYGGCYEGGEWAAFNYYPDSAELDGHDDDDVTCSGWWIDHEGDPKVSVGNSPDEAFKKLEVQLGLRSVDVGSVRRET